MLAIGGNASAFAEEPAKKRDQLVKQLVIDLFKTNDADKRMTMLDVPFYNGMDAKKGVITERDDLKKIDLIEGSAESPPKIDEIHLIVWMKSKEAVDLRIKSKGIFKDKEARERYLAFLQKEELQKHLRAVLRNGDHIVVIVHEVSQKPDIDFILVGTRKDNLKIVGASD